MSDESLSHDSSQEEKLDGIVEEILERKRLGLKPSIEEFVGLYPDLEQDLRELFPALDMAERLRSTQYSTLQTGKSDSDRILNQNSKRFQILRPLDRGGLGVVSVAMDVELHRKVALKEIREDRADDRGLRSKFILEAEVTGGLEHPGIVPVYALGASADGRPYYAMRLIKGSNLRDHIRTFHEDVNSGKIPFDGPQLRQLIRRFLVVCEAIDYAHSRGVLHRDLKPSNIMLGRYGETLVVDWGLAKATGFSGASTDEHNHDESTGLEVSLDQETPMIPSGSDGATRDGSAIGTPGYAPPEQILGQSECIGVRSDVYGLGSILYELLTNRAPATGSLLQITQQVTSGNIVSCRSIQPLVPKSIESICSMAMAVRYNDRYASAGLMRTELERWLDDEPVLSYQEPFLVRMKRWLRYHQTLASTMLAIGFMTILGSILIAISVTRSNAKLISLNSALDKTNSELVESNHRETLARNEAEKRERAERWERYRTSLAATITSKQVDNRTLMQRSLESAPVEFRNWEWRHFDSQLEELSEKFPGGSKICPTTLKHAIIRNSDEVHLTTPGSNKPPSILKHDSAIAFVQFGPDSATLAVVLLDNRIVVWDLGKEQQIASSQADSRITDLLFHPSRPVIHIGIRGEFCFASWDYSKPEPIARNLRLGDPSYENPPSFNKTGDRLLCNLNPVMVLYRSDTESDKMLLEMKAIGLGFSHDGSKFLILSQNRLQVRDSTNGDVLHESDFLGESATYWRCDWSLDGSKILIGGRFPYLSVLYWDLTTGKLSELQGHSNGIWDVKLSPDGLTGLSVSQDMTARIWDLATGKERHVLRGHRTPVRSGTFSHDGKRIVTTGDDANSRVWNSDSGHPIAILVRHASERELCFSDDDSVITSRNSIIQNDALTSIWQTKVIEQNGILRGHTNYVYDVIYSADGRQIASAAWDGTIRLWDAKTGKTTRVFRPNTPDNIGFRSIAISPDGKRLVGSGIFSSFGEVVVWDVESEAPSQHWTCAADTEDFRASFDCTGKIVLAGTTDGSIRCLDAENGKMLSTLNGHEIGLHVSRYSKTCSDVIAHPDRKRWFSAGFDGNILVWDVQSGKQISKMSGHMGVVFRIRTSRDGSLLASTGLDGKVMLWNLDTYELVATLDHGSSVYSASFTPDGSRLATGAADGLIRLWDLATYSQVAELHGHSDYVHAVDFSPDGTQLVSGSGDHTVRVWDTISPKKRSQ